MYTKIGSCIKLSKKEYIIIIIFTSKKIDKKCKETRNKSSLKENSNYI